jgi:iron complex outermembrane receptor protein
VGRAFRAPTFNERFFVPGGRPSLRAESGWSAEAGAQVQVGTENRLLRSEVTLFTTRLHQQIVWKPSYVGPGLQVWRPSNIGQVRTRGLEWTATGRWHLGPEATLNGRMAFTHVAATDRSNPRARSFGHQLPYRPRQRLKARAGLSWRWARVGLSSRLVGPRSVTADETQSLPPFRVTNVRVQVQQTVGPATVTAALRLRNLFDTEYSVVRLYPMPPRHVRARLTIALDP